MRDMAEARHRLRRKRIAFWAAGVLILLPLASVQSYLYLRWATSKGHVSLDTFHSLADSVYEPLDSYRWSFHFGGVEWRAFTSWGANPEKSLSDVYAREREREKVRLETSGKLKRKNSANPRKDSSNCTTTYR
jgi:hypothetical protein